MNKAIYTVGAAAALLGSSLLSSSASALCQTTKQYNGGTDRVECNAQSDSGTNNVFRIPANSNNYDYSVGGFGVESFAQGILLNSTGAQVRGNRTDGTVGPCIESFNVVGSGTRLFACKNTTTLVASIRIRVD